MITILIPEKIPAHNKGEEAIFRGIGSTLDFIPEKRIILYSHSPDYDGKQYFGDVDIISQGLMYGVSTRKTGKIFHWLSIVPLHFLFGFLYRINKSFAKKIFTGKLWKVYDEINFVLAGHDNAYSMLHNFLILFCKIINKPIIVYGASIVPAVHNKPWARFLTRFSLNLSDLVTVREKITKDILIKEVGVNPDLVKLTADKAFLLTPIKKIKAIELLCNYGIKYEKEPLIGMTILYESGFFNKLPFDKKLHITIMADFINYIIESTKSRIILFPHSIGPDRRDDDRIAAEAVLDEIKLIEKITIIVDDLTASELKGMIGCCNFFIGERTHSVIAAVSMIVPSIVITHPKDYRTMGIFGDIKGIADRIYDITKLDLASLQVLFLDSWRHRTTIANALRQSIPAVVNNAYSNRNYLWDTLKKRRII